jgi:hypothetical protein
MDVLRGRCFSRVNARAGAKVQSPERLFRRGVYFPLGGTDGPDMEIEPKQPKPEIMPPVPETDPQRSPPEIPPDKNAPERERPTQGEK